MKAPLRLLTKSRFKVACECPTKLYYEGKAEYGSTKSENTFLSALAEGGFQVGELAKLYSPGGLEVHSLDSPEAVLQSLELLERERVTLYEAALSAGDLLVRVDILRKNGSQVDLIEVKAKGFDPSDSSLFWNKKMKGLAPKWEPYLLDIAFQAYVARKAFPEWELTPYLMLADKTATASVDGLNQLFRLSNEGERVRIELEPGLSAENLGAPILREVDVTAEVNFIHREWELMGRDFESLVAELSDAYVRDRRFEVPVDTHCKRCEFRIPEDLKADGFKSGFDECWTRQKNLSKEDFQRPFVFDLWNYRQSQRHLAEGRVFIDQMDLEEFEAADPEYGPLSPSARQGLQVQKVIENSASAYLDSTGLLQEFACWTYPFHFIDFETSMVAIPFHAGRRPYEQIAFQFSHHMVFADGSVKHASEFLECTPGKFPNFEFVRALRAALSKDRGTIFRYSPHENTVLCQIHEQLQDSTEPDRDELCRWIETITFKKEKGWTGARAMVDLFELIKSYFYHPLTGGSISIKKVLPAVLASSDYLRSKYAGQALDPYASLKSGEGASPIADGAAAMTAYARLQFLSMSAEERHKTEEALLKYCKLDTWAMVLLFEHLAHEIGWQAEDSLPKEC